ncbi:MAG: GNAT family N-acetyltransferase [Gemmatimonadaceae bacterium]
MPVSLFYAIGERERDSTTDLADGMRSFRARSDADVFVADRGDGSLAGFVEVGVCPYAEGCESSPVGYIEAWFVDPDVRRAGLGRALLAAAEAWARAGSCPLRELSYVIPLQLSSGVDMTGLLSRVTSSDG